MLHTKTVFPNTLELLIKLQSLPELKDFVLVGGTASLEDIAAMKISAITNRGTKKDFIDIYYLLGVFDLPQIMSFYQKKYPEASEFLAYKSLIYFDDAESDPMPKMFSNVNLVKIKKRILEISDKEIL